jgi:hypothetical protein
MSALKLLVPVAPLYTYPVTVVLGKAQFQDPSYYDTVLNLAVIVEVFARAVKHTTVD